MATFILVHGTFARGAEWTRPDSPLCEHLRSVVPKDCGGANFVAIKWSGRNRVRDRQDAALNIAEAVEQLIRIDSEEKIILMGHSHGGSAIAYFLKRSTELRRHILGASFLATPFITLRLFPLLGDLFEAIALTAALLLLLCITVAVGRIDLMSGNSDSPIAIASVLLASLTASIALLAFFSRLPLSRIEARVRNRIAPILRQQQTSILPSGIPFLFLRISGDEAAAVLAVGQFLGWLTSFAATSLARIVNRIKSVEGFARRTLVGRCCGALFVVLSQMWMLGYAKNLMRDHTLTLFRFLADARLITGIPALDRYAPLLIVTKILGVCAFFMAALICVTVAVFLIFLFFRMLVSLLALMVFGISDALKNSPIVDFAVEPIPVGVHTFAHVGWDPRNAIGLSHSQAYLYADAIQLISEWTVRCLAPSSSVQSASDR